MAKAIDDLKAAFAGESQANRRYLAFAKKADEEGHAQVAKLFRAAAAAETVHAHNHLRALGGVKSTAENLEEAISGESHEVLNMYPGMIKDAEGEGHKLALNSFKWAWEVEKTHEALYRKAKGNLGQGGETFDYYVCLVCGHTHEKSAPDKCPVCGAPKAKFEKVS
ncbi:MAG: rubrerythrin family protein [Proteobacteria bacterium]|nr:rubrerythrin family protein [Pseudomonadota bacterium]